MISVTELQTWMSRKDAAKELGCTVPGVAAMIQAGKLEAIQMGSAWLVSPESVKARRAIRKADLIARLAAAA